MTRLRPRFEAAGPFRPTLPRVPGAYAPFPLRDPPPRGPQLGRLSYLGEKSELGVRPPTQRSGCWSYFPADSFRDPLPLLCVLGLYKRVLGDAARAAALESKGKRARFLSPYCPLSPPSSDFLGKRTNLYFVDFLFLILPPRFPSLVYLCSPLLPAFALTRDCGHRESL